MSSVLFSALLAGIRFSKQAGRHRHPLTFHEGKLSEPEARGKDYKKRVRESVHPHLADYAVSSQMKDFS